MRNIEHTINRSWETDVLFAFFISQSELPKICQFSWSFLWVSFWYYQSTLPLFSNSLIFTFFFINSLNNHTMLPLADGLFDSKSAGIVVSLWWCVISERETVTTKSKPKYFLVLQHILPGPIHKSAHTFSSEMSEPCPIIFYAQPGLSCPSMSYMKCRRRYWLHNREQLALGDLRSSNGKLFGVTDLGLLVLTWCLEPGCPARSLQHLSLPCLRKSFLEIYSPRLCPDCMQAEIPLLKIASISHISEETQCPPSLPAQNVKANWPLWLSLFSRSHWRHWNRLLMKWSLTILILEKLTRPSSVKFGVPSSINARSVRYIPR